MRAVSTASAALPDDAPHLLVVDDDRRIRDLLSRFLFAEGYRVTTAETAADARASDTPEVLLLRSAQQRALNEAVEALPVEFREVFVLREIEGLSYKEIADLAHVPIGTVMSRLARARRRLQAAVGRAGRAGSTS